MGKYKYRISHMIPNAWFHKLKDMTKPKPKPKTKPSSSSSNTFVKKKPSLDSLPHHSSTYYFSNNLVADHYNSPRNSLHMSKRKTLYKPSLKPLTSSCTHNKSKINNQDSSDFLFPSLESSPQSLVYSFYEEDDDESSNFKINTKTIKNNVKESGPIVKACLTSNLMNKPRKDSLCLMISKEIEEEEEEECECKAKKKYKKQVSSGRKSPSGINLKRVNSPRIQLSRSSSETKQAVLESFAVIKSSIDPKKDFRESMVEMIEENNISDSKDLEDLLACYLTLNPKEYHDLIIQVFEQIWCQLAKKKQVKT